MASLVSLAAKPTFKATVPVPVAGSTDIPVTFTFKYRDRKALQAFQVDMNVTEAENVLQIAEGWNLDDAFTADNIEALLDQRPGTFSRIFDVYLGQSYGARSGN